MTTKKAVAFRPLGDRVLLKRLDMDEKTPGGLWIPGNAQEKPQRAEVVSVGPGRVTDDGKLIEPRIKAGDVVVFGKYSGTEIKIDGIEHVVCREEDVLGVET